MYNRIFLLFLLSFLFLMNLSYSAQVSGLVFDTYDNLVVGSDLDFDCSNINEMQFPNKTNHFGSFKIENISNASCRIFAKSNNLIGFVDLEILNSDMKTKIILDKTGVDNARFKVMNFLYFLLILIMLILVIYFLFFNKKKRISNFKDLDKKEILISEKMNGIINTLGDNEKLVIRYLIENGGFDTANKIRINTQIPRD